MRRTSLLKQFDYYGGLLLRLVEQAAHLGYSALAITGNNSLAGVVKAHVTAKELNGLLWQRIHNRPGLKLVAIALTGSLANCQPDWSI